MADFGNFNASDDPTADFLAREKELLGDDAAFVTGTGLTDMSTFPPVDAFGGAAIQTTGASIPLPASPAQTPQIPPGPHSAKADEGKKAMSPVAPSPIPEVESEHIKKWRESFLQKVAERDAKESKAKQETIEKAKRDIDKFYEDYNTKREKALQENKALQEKLLKDLNDTVTGTYWERVLKHIELVSDTQPGPSKGVASNVSITKKAQTGCQKDTTRFKQVLLSLKQAKTSAPGA